MLEPMKLKTVYPSEPISNYNDWMHYIQTQVRVNFFSKNPKLVISKKSK